MNRRKFLSGVSQKASLAVSAAALSATWPEFLRRAFADEPKAGQPAGHHAELDGLAVVSEGYRRAQRAGKPLLVLIIPQDDSAKWKHGRALGAWLNHGSAEQLWPLSLCEVACAKLDDLRRLVPSVGLGEPLMILVETDAVPATIFRLDAKLADIEARSLRGRSATEDWREMQRQEDQLVDSHIETLARLAKKALIDGAGRLERRAAQARSVLSALELDQLAHGEPLPELLDRGAAVYVAAHPAIAQRSALLAAVVSTRLGKHRVPGSHWASSMGCGTHIEGHPEIGRGIMCGMGHVPEKCSRFLYFYTIPNQKDGGIIL